MRSLRLTIISVITGAAMAADPVVVELFTSEGCSSCPPADRVCRELVAQDGDLIMLGWHVTYWDGLGWREPFGLAQAAERQQEYGSRLGTQISTPQVVVDGQVSLLGSDQQGITEACRDQRAHGGVRRLTLACAWTGDQCQASVTSPVPAQATLLIALTEDGLQSAVTAGENRGKSLVHARVVRCCSTTTPGRSASLSAPAEAIRDHLSVVAIASDSSGRIIAAGQIPAK